MSRRTLYNTLGVSPTNTNTTIKKAYRKLAVKYHPDKGGETENFQTIQGAWNILRDKDSRKVYNLNLEKPAEDFQNIYAEESEELKRQEEDRIAELKKQEEKLAQERRAETRKITDIIKEKMRLAKKKNNEKRNASTRRLQTIIKKKIYNAKLRNLTEKWKKDLRKRVMRNTIRRRPTYLRRKATIRHRAQQI
uniref:J domain-containing protein n=1 Tax=viral metagenome TaxID=1070528 RepID=A0A6C0AMK1_9ZZZZ